MARRHLVVGGSGYVGRALCLQLAEQGEEVATLNRSDGNIDDRIEWIQGDITDAGDLKRALADKKFNVIYHVASLPGDTGDPLQMVEVNLVGLTNMLNFARESGVDGFVHSSSISAYEWYPATKFSAPDYEPVDEAHPCRPRDMYASSKRMQEILAMTFYHQYELPVSSLRLTAVVGPGGRGGGRGWREFAEKLAEGKSVQIPHFSLEEVCHYVDSRDVAGMHIAAGAHEKAHGEIFNCCGPGETSGNDFAQAIQKHYPGIEVETGFPWSMAQGGRISFDMSKAARLIDFRPQFTVEDSVLAIKAWIDSGGLDEDRSAEDKAYGGGVEN
jgi:nucleoside-diphosphate-sugar epimerase